MVGYPEELSRYLWNLDKDKKYEIKEYKPKRSLSQNSYAWVLINELANKMRLSKEEVYIGLLEDYSQCLMIPVEKGKKPNGYFKYYKYIATTSINGKEADYYKVFKGSSEFDTEEMSIFLDGIIQECKQLGIETMTPEQIALMELV